MIFATYWFIVFAFVVVVGWAALPPRWRLVWLLGASLVFHRHFAGAAGMLPIALLGAATYLLARTRRPDACVAGIVLSAAALAFYKYGHFLATDVLGLLSASLAEWVLAGIDRLQPVTPPLAISFFTFEFVHYLVEVRRGRTPIRSPFEFGLFTVFFPSLAAGPIKRYQQFIPALHAGRRGVAREDLAAGLGRIIVGYAKKLLIADNLTTYLSADEHVFATASLGGRWIFLAALAIRILADFSGYSDIAIGLARVFGIRLPENFNWPYIATNMQEFWQRWHISLSTWIRDYIYIPMGGNQLGPVRRMVNAFLAMALCGLWHGPAWNFVAWGVYHGLGLAVSTYYATALGPLGGAIAALLRRAPLLGWVLTTLFVWFGWLLFFYPVSQAVRMATLLVSP
jgi:alginate O-acetyltransferase complex protein AlgI